MDFDFDQIGEMLQNMSAEDLQSLQETAQSLFGAFGGPEAPSPEPDAQPKEKGGQRTASGGFSDVTSMLTPELLAKLSQMMRMMNQKDPRTELISALKPHLSHRRQKRADEAMRMMQMMQMMPMLQDQLRK
ncbi:MAG: hypothetical protein LBJ11_03595 [Oscillospiraceae bacterium]|jgi:hypothetical protein|nr:hypothetical protein [Oscillospiraceae bacterium]